MEELSIEQKAKRYDEAIKRLEDIMTGKCQKTFMFTKGLFDYIFPELKENKESDDEKIINNIKKVIGWYRGMFTEKSLIPEEYQEIDAWLEKQGEHKPTAEEVLIKAGLKPYKDGNQWCVLLGDNIQEGICGFGNTIEDALYAFLKDLIASQGEQKLNGTFANVDDVREDFVQEVYRVLDADSTNDRANQIIDYFDNLPTVTIEKQGERKHQYKSRPRYVGEGELLGKKISNKKPTKWSKEVEAAISLLKDIAEEQEKDYCPHNANDLRKAALYLETCRSQSTLKPSDEHYELEEFARVVRGNLTGISKTVQKLFEAKYLQLTGRKMYIGFKD